MQAGHHEDIAHTNVGDAQLFDRYGQAIFSYVRLHTASQEDAEDMTLEVFVAALENDNLAAIPADEQLAWLRRVAHNKLVDSYRRTSRRPHVALDPYRETLLSDENTRPEQIAEQRETQQHLLQAIEQLPTQQQQLLRLRFGDGLRFAEIATLFNKREDAVRKMLSRTLMTLRTIYSKHEQQERRS